MSIQTNSEALERILEMVNDLPEGTQLPTLSNAGTASDLASGKQLIDQNGNIVTGTHQCQAGVTVQRYPASGYGSFTTNTSGSATVNCGFQPDVVYIRGAQEYDTEDEAMNSYNCAIVFAEEDRENPVTPMGAVGGTYDMLWSKSSTGFTVMMYKFDYDWDATRPRETFSFVAIKYTA